MLSKNKVAGRETGVRRQESGVRSQESGDLINFVTRKGVIYIELLQIVEKRLTIMPFSDTKLIAVEDLDSAKKKKGE